MSGRGLRGGSSLADSAQASLAPYLVTRLVTLAALESARLVSRQLHGEGALALRARGATHAGLLSWDAAWYVRIASEGYRLAGHQSLRFFPLYPLCVRALSTLGMSDSAAALVLANVAGFAALVLLHSLVAAESLGRSTASRTVWLLSVWPASFVLMMGYAESLFLVVSVAAFSCWRRRWWLAAVLPAFCAGLCRPVGFLLALPALYEGAAWLRARGGRLRLSPVVSIVLSVAAAPAGTATYLGWSAATGRGFATPLSEQLTASRRGGVADPFVTLFHDGIDFVHGHHLGTAIHAPVALLLVALVLYALVRLPASYGLYGLASVAVSLAAPNLNSLERYALASFPLAVAGALVLERRPLERTALSLLAAGLALAAMLAFLGLYVP